MQIAKNRTMATLIALFLISAMAISLVALPAATAAVPLLTKKTYAYIGATPNPVGVGQETLIHLGITDELQVYTDGWSGLTVTVTRPDGTTETLGPFRTDSTGGTGTVYVPSTVGNYTLQTHFPAQRYNWTLYGGASVWYEASDSSKLTLIVTEEPGKFWPGIPLPTEYWTRPIDAQAREWYTISGSWLTSPPNLYAPYNDGPESAHILWAKPLVVGGLVGGELGLVGSGGTSVGFETGDAYEGFFSGSVIIAGRLFYNRYKADGSTRVEQEVVCVDLHTGEELWVRNWNNTRLAFGQLFYWQSFNYQGTFAYLWTTVGTTWNAYDPLTGRWVYTMTDVPSGTNLYGPRGEIYRYTVDLTRGWMTLWNSSRAVQPQTAGTSTDGSWIRAQMGTTINATRGIEWNKTIPKGLPGSDNAYFLFDRIIGSNLVGRTAENLISGRINKPIPLWGISLKLGQEGLLLFNTTWTPPQTDLFISWGAESIKDGVFTLWSKETRQYWGFSMDTGKPLWGPTESQHYLDMFGQRRFIAYGKLFAQGMSGILYCYDAKTGKLLWTYSYRDPFNEVLWANDWSIRPLFFTDGKIYMGQSEHSGNQPLPRGAPFVCVDVETGKEVWSITGAFRQTDWGGRAIIGDSTIVTMDTYDQRIYAISKGPSKTTVAASPKVSVHGSSVLVEGMVTDVSPGTKDAGLMMRFPNGVPAVSDASMSDWMKYVYMQFPRPANATGVEVTLDTVDPNGNWIHIGTVKSDSSGLFSYAFTPEVPGKYTIIATFPGSKSYYASYAETAIFVEEAPPATPPPAQPQPAPDTTLTIIAATIAIIIAVAIVGILILRKRP